MVSRLNGPRPTAKLPLLRYPKPGAAVERAHATRRQSRQRRRLQMNDSRFGYGRVSQIRTYAELGHRINPLFFLPEVAAPSLAVRDTPGRQPRNRMRINGRMKPSQILSFFVALVFGFLSGD